MPYIAREDGEHFVIPSYRDVLTAKSKSQLKKDILLLSQSYGEYITLQKKSASQYEIAFSPDTGYLLGESIWHFFKRPADLIYCEAIPGTSEALLVIVKTGSVYLDGSFPLDSIPEELVIFLTQQNNFEIYTYGDVPISELPEEGKFSFEANSVKSFAQLDAPVFPTLPLVKAYQLQLVNQVLKSYGIGIFPLRKLVGSLAIIFIIWFAYHYLTRQKVVPVVMPSVNPYQGYNNALTSPAPNEELKSILQLIAKLYTIPGWHPTSVTFAPSTLTASVISRGGTLQDLFQWAQINHIKPDVTPNGINLVMQLTIPNRPLPTRIYPLRDAVASFVDNVARIYPGNHLKIGEILIKGSYVDMTFTLSIDDEVSPIVISLIADQLRDLPFVLQKLDFKTINGNLTGSITFEALGSQT